MAGKRRRTELATKPRIHQKRIKLNPLNDIVRLCDRCARMVNGSNELKSLMSPVGYSHSSKVELFANARNGCPICYWIHHYLRHMWINTPSGQVYFHALNSSRSAPKPSRPNRLVATIHPLLDQDIDFLTDLEMPKIYFSISSRPKGFNTAARLESYLQKSQTKIIDMSNSEAIQRARIQLKECQTSHRKCPRNRAAPALPTRVLDVGLSGDPLIKLHISGRQQHGEFLALSYCWGGSQKCQTTEDTIDEHSDGIVLQDLSLSIQDAVEVTRQLGFQYLWVDALCIIQDSKEDKDAEISLMGAIYKNATLVFAASNAINAEEGFLRRVPAAKHFKLPYELSDGNFALVDVSLMGASFEDPFKHRAKRPFLLSREREPLDNRGWALQEGLLPRRLLSWGTNEMTWKCPSEAITKVPNGVNTSKPLPLSIFNKVEKEQNEANLQRDQINTWHSIVEDYTRRELSKRSDYEPAISGIASELAICWNDKCLAGMWRRTLVANLAWRVVDIDLLWAIEQSSIEKGRYPPLEAPSWSWLSKLAKVSFFTMTDIKMEFGRPPVASS
ncbi:uncharacterized protein PAC_08730 [Phialocephala subalpina]|uniref:Heterokaryon incompatibility domain-containing protein n=1 Tax=Phialocephala subalpina TaxID=576137 RepID=A0A1L7X1D7_9HELO|nr:uncharacterized protein PAC_08730 [Phialocephala subalpina]